MTVCFLHFIKVLSFPPSGGLLADWLQKRDSYPILDLSYLEVGLGSQSIHMEFGDGDVAYTLLLRDSVRCKRFFGILTGKMKPHQTQQSGRCGAALLLFLVYWTCSRYWNNVFPPTGILPQTEKPNPLPSLTNAAPYVCSVTQVSAQSL